MICKACNQEIDIIKERYTHIEDFNCKHKVGDSWWHVKCFKQAMNRELNELEQTAKTMLKKASTIYQNLPEEFKQEEYVTT